MNIQDTIKVLVVDDSAFNRQAITSILREIPEIQVVGRAMDGEDGLRQALFYKPDLITLDLNMPRLDGFSFLRIIMARQPTPTIVISSDSRKESIFQALELGAIDFVVKPSNNDEISWKKCAEELIGKIKTLPNMQAKPRQRIAPSRTKAMQSEQKDEVSKTKCARIVAIGSSTGGPAALVSIISQLQYRQDSAVLIAQHMPSKFTGAFAKRLDGMSAYTVKEASHGEPLMGGHIYLAPGGIHMLIKKVGNDLHNVILRTSSSRDRYSPSVDELFASIAHEWDKPSIGIVLTGMGSDGKEGVVKLKQSGSNIYAESEESAVIFGMPKEAHSTGVVTELLNLDGLANIANTFIDGSE